MSSPKGNLERFIGRIKKDKRTSDFNRRKILEFVRDRGARGNAPNTIIKYLYPIYQMNAKRWISKNFDKVTKEDVQEILAKIENESWTAKTKKNFKLTLKVFYKWFEGEDKFGPGEYPLRVKFISTTIPRRERKELDFNEIISREEVIKMAQQALNPMHKAFVWAAFESGARPEEILNLKNTDVKFDNQGAVIFLSGAKSRRAVRLVSATEPLRDWLRRHPLKERANFNVWVTQFSKIKDKEEVWTPLGNVGANKIIKVLANRSGITKRLTIYSLRKGRATELASSSHISRAVLHAFMGWEEGSSISKSYVKLSLKDVDEAVLRANGVDIGKETIDSFVECSWCGHKCSPGSLYCENSECGKPLVIVDEKGEIKKLIKQLSGERKELIKELVRDPEFEKSLMEALKNWQNSKAIVKTMQETTGY
jgi:integrase